MSDFIQGVQVGTEVKQYDYKALGNKPDLLTVDTTLTKGGKAADAKVTGQKFTEVDNKFTTRDATIQQIKTDLNNTNVEVTSIKTSLAETNKQVGMVNTTSANALKGTASGSMVSVNDVSPIEHTVDTIVRSKNLWTTDLTYPTKNIEYDEETQVYTFNGATNATLYTLPKPIPKGTTVTITANVISGNVTSLGDGGIAFGGYHKGATTSWQGYINIPEMTNTDISGQTYTQTFETTEDVTNFYAFIYASSATIHEPLKVKVQYEISPVATEYTPYIDPSTTTLTYGGKTYTPNSNGSVDGLVSTSPTMEMSVPDGFNIFLEYNQDTNAVIKKLTDAIVALGGTV